MWINGTPQSLEKLRGKVVLIEFWAFDCPYCAEAMPHVKEIYDRYASKGLVVIGVHTPRFEREKDIEKIRETIKARAVPYPVVVDNDYAIWTDYACAAWPAIYIVDQEGTIRLSHSGTGRYEDMEAVVKDLLGDGNAK